MAAPGASDAQRQRGFALLIVLWTLALISFLVAYLAASGRTEVRIAGNLAANAAAQAAADGAVSQAIFNLSDPRPERRWALDGAVHEIHIGRSQIALRVENEAARINPNLASSELLEALLRVVGTDPETAAALAAAIAEWIGKPHRSGLKTARLDYQALGLDYRPPRSPLESIDELALVHGMTPEVLAALRPHLTLFGPAEPDPAGGDPEVAAALALTGGLAPGSGSRPDPAAPVTVRILVAAHGPGDALATRRAVTRISPDAYVLLAWDRGDG